MLHYHQAFVLLALCCATLAFVDPIDMTRSRADSSHSIHTPTAGQRADGDVPDLETTTGRKLNESKDGAGSTTFVVSDGWAGSLQFQCSDKLDNKFSFFFNRTYNSIVGENPFKGSARAWFGDDVTKTAGMGENLESGTLGVDVFTSCPQRQ